MIGVVPGRVVTLVALAACVGSDIRSIGPGGARWFIWHRFRDLIAGLQHKNESAPNHDEAHREGDDPNSINLRHGVPIANGVRFRRSGFHAGLGVGSQKYFHVMDRCVACQFAITISV